MGFFSFLYDVILITGTGAIGVLGACFITSQFVYLKTSDENLVEDSEDEVNFEELYKEQFLELEKTVLPMDHIIEEFITELETPAGHVIMMYDLATKRFHYYSDRRNIPVRFLDVVAQKFVIENDCLELYLTEPEPEREPTPEEANIPEDTSYYNWMASYFYSSSQAEQAQAEQAQAEQAQAEQAQAEQAQAEQAQAEQSEAEQAQAEQSEEEENSVFATYKKKNVPVSEKTTKAIEKIINSYKYIGTLVDYEQSVKKTQPEPSLEVSFSNYKEMVKNKTE
jgi:hypothetical protein